MAENGGATCLLEAGEHERRLAAWRALLDRAARTPRTHGSS